MIGLSTIACDPILIKAIPSITSAGVRANSIMTVLVTSVTPFMAFINICDKSTMNINKE